MLRLLKASSALPRIFVVIKVKRATKGIAQRTAK
jgi:hypothetical protein